MVLQRLENKNGQKPYVLKFFNIDPYPNRYVQKPTCNNTFKNERITALFIYMTQ